MENQKNRKSIITLLIAIIVILSVLCVLFATGTISFKSNNVDSSEENQNIKEDDDTKNDDTSNDKDDSENMNEETNNEMNDEMNDEINDEEHSDSYVDTNKDNKLSDYAFERYIKYDDTIELYINNKLVVFEDEGMNRASHTVKKMNDKVFIVEKILASSDLYAVNEDAKVIGIFTVGNSDYFKETTILPTKAYYRDTYRIEGNNIYVQTDLFGNGGVEHTLCNKEDSDIVIYEEKFEYLGNDTFSVPVTTKTITRKQYMDENNIVCK